MALETVRRSARGGHLWGDVRGVVSVEAVLVLPVLLSLWLGCQMIYEGALARQVAQADARNEAWRFALEGCPEVGGSMKNSTPAGYSESEDELDKDSALAMAAAQPDPDPDADLDDPPVVDESWFEFVLGERFEISCERETPSAPSLEPFEGKPLKVKVVHSLMCNTRPQSWDEWLSKVWDGLTD